MHCSGARKVFLVSRVDHRAWRVWCRRKTGEKGGGGVVMVYKISLGGPAFNPAMSITITRANWGEGGRVGVSSQCSLFWGPQGFACFKGWLSEVSTANENWMHNQPINRSRRLGWGLGCWRCCFVPAWKIPLQSLVTCILYTHMTPPPLRISS